MSLSKHARVAAVFCWVAALLAVSTRGYGQTNYYSPYGTEYSVVGSLPGDQMSPDVSINTAGGVVVWQDNVTDGNGLGISARRLDNTLSGTLGNMRVNVQGTNDQHNPRVAMLKNGGAAFVWEGGASGSQQIFARFLSPTNTWMTTTDLVVSTFTNTFQKTPALAVLNDSNVVVVWSSFNQAGSGTLLDVYGTVLSPTGKTVVSTFLINQFTAYNQRTPAVAALKNGGFAVAWVSELEQSAAMTTSNYYSANGFPLPSVDIYMRLYNSNAVAQGSEFPVDTTSSPCANPSLAAGSDGGLMVAWSQHDPYIFTNGWDVYARPVSSTGVGGTVFRVNSFVYGDQFAPKVSAIGLDYMIVWTSMGQDGSHEGVYRQFVHNNGAMVGKEFLVNTTTVGRQMQPAVASDGAAWFDVVWTSFTGGPNSFDLFAQRYANVSAILEPMSAPIVWAPFDLVSNKYVPLLVVSWPSLLGISVTNFDVYVDGAAITNWLGTTNQWTMGPANGLTINSTHSFQVAYQTTDGRQSPISPATSATTWSGTNYYGIPIEWMEEFYGSPISYANFQFEWPTNVNAPLIPGGMSLMNVFLSGGNPLDPSTWLTTSMVRTSEGMFLYWNTSPGLTYQVQETTNLMTWSNVGSARFAAGTNDSVFVGGGSAGLNHALYHVQLLRP